MADTDLALLSSHDRLLVSHDFMQFSSLYTLFIAEPEHPVGGDCCAVHVYIGGGEEQGHAGGGGGGGLAPSVI